MYRVFIYIIVALLPFSCGKSDSAKHEYKRQLHLGDELVAFIFEENGKQGLEDTLGNVILPAKYDYIEDWVQFGVVRTDLGGEDQSGDDYIHYEMNKIGLVDYKGNVLFEPQFDELNFAGYPLAVVSKDGKYGFINNNGEIIIDLKYDSAGIFQNGFAVIKTDSGFGLINPKDEFIIEPNLDTLMHGYATGYSKDTMILIFNHYEEVKYINKQGEIFKLNEPAANRVDGRRS